MCRETVVFVFEITVCIRMKSTDFFFFFVGPFGKLQADQSIYNYKPMTYLGVLSELM
jgi:hypothetical protein